MALETQGKK